VPAHRFQIPYIPIRNAIALRLSRLNSSRNFPCDMATSISRSSTLGAFGSCSTATFLAVVHTDDSFMPNRNAHSRSATTTRWAKMIRAPRIPNGESARPARSTTVGPMYHSTCATPLCLPR
jgi:hypothetical protein